MTDDAPGKREGYGFTRGEIAGWAFVVGLPIAVIVMGVLIVLLYEGPVAD